MNLHINMRLIGTRYLYVMINIKLNVYLYTYYILICYSVIPTYIIIV